jgi:hypothetical protein
MTDVALPVPFVSQYDAYGNGGNDCGPACLTSMLAANGACEPTPETMFRIADRTRDGILDGKGRQGGYVEFADLMAEAKRYGYDSWWLNNVGAIDAALIDGRQPVLILVDNTVLTPRQYPVAPAFNARHFILLTGIEGDDYLVGDPLSLAKAPGRYTRNSVQRGAKAVGVMSFCLDADPLLTEEDEMTNAQCEADLAEANAKVAERDAIIGELVRANAGLVESLGACNSQVGALTHDAIPALEEQIRQLEAQLAACQAQSGSAECEAALAAAQTRLNQIAVLAASG